MPAVRWAATRTSSWSKGAWSGFAVGTEAVFITKFFVGSAGSYAPWYVKKLPMWFGTMSWMRYIPRRWRASESAL
ncbi:MAG: hypothetical protein QM704_21785 [Anaeromyxobacteraceae bacterium]